MVTVVPSSDDCSAGWQTMFCKVHGIISNRFLEHDSEFVVCKWPPQSPDLITIKQLQDVIEQNILSWMSNWKSCSNCVMLIWTKISEDQQFVQSAAFTLKWHLWQRGWYMKAIACFPGGHHVEQLSLTIMCHVAAGDKCHICFMVSKIFMLYSTSQSTRESNG